MSLGIPDDIGALPEFRPRAGWALFFALLAFYAATQQRSNWDFGWDGYCRFVMMETVLKTGRAQVMGIPGFYPMFHAGASVAMLPLYLVGETVDRWAGRPEIDYGREFCFNFFTIVTAAGAVLFARILERLGVGARKAAVSAVIYAVGTMAWPYAGEMQTEPLVACCLLAVFEAMLAYRDDGQGRWMTRAGLASALAILTRPESVVPLAPLFVYGWLAGRESRSRASRGDTLWLLALTSLGPLGVLGWNWLRFGSPWDSGYAIEGQDVRFSTPLAIGLFGQLFSSGKGALWHNPVLILAMLGWPAWTRARRLEAWTCGVAIALTVGLYAKFWNWAGDASWGPRYMLIPLPFAMLPLAYVDWSGWGRFARGLAVAVLAVSVWIQVLGAFVPIRQDYAYKSDPAIRRMEVALKIADDNDVLVHYIPDYSPLLLHADRFQGLRTSLRWFPYDSTNGRRIHPMGIGWIGLLVIASRRAYRRIT